MFNGRWKDKMQKDTSGDVFLDVSPVLFRLLLDYLTTRRLAGTNNIPFPNVDANQLPQFKLMLKYFEVEAAIYSSKHFPHLTAAPVQICSVRDVMFQSIPEEYVH